MVGLPERENFKEIKDAIRHAVKRSGAAILDPVPRVHLRDGLAWFEVEDYDDALTTQRKDAKAFDGEDADVCC